MLSKLVGPYCSTLKLTIELDQEVDPSIIQANPIMNQFVGVMSGTSGSSKGIKNG